MVTLVTGGNRSGKSSYACSRALECSDEPVYVATAKIWDDEFRRRVERHQQDRDARWTNMEEQIHLSQLPINHRTCVVDCVTLWLTNIFMTCGKDIDSSLQMFRTEAKALMELQTTLFIVTNEIGMGLHADTETGRKFADLQGWANQYLARKADEVILMVSGIPLEIKKMSGHA